LAGQTYIWGTGRRKSSVARVRLCEGSGNFIVNKRHADSYFTNDMDRNAVVAPLQATDMLGKVDIFVNVAGGGLTGQAGAVVLGVARALKKYDSQCESPLRDAGFLTRDGRMKERKKYGRHGARRGFQFSKR